MSAALYHVERSNVRGASRLFAASREKLERVEKSGFLHGREGILEFLAQSEQLPGSGVIPRLVPMEAGLNDQPAGWCTKA